MAATTPADAAIRDFRAIYRGHYGLVWHALLRFGVDATVIDDAIQDVFVVAYRRRADVRGPSVKAWLYGIARRVASNYRRSDRRRSQREQAVRATADRRQRHHVDAHDAIQILDRYLASLHADDRELFILSQLEGMTGPEIAQARDRNLQTVYTRIRKLRQQARARLEDIEQVRQARPRASAQSWALLVPTLQGSAKPAIAATGWTAALTSGWTVAALGVALTAGALVAADRLRPPPPEAEPAASVASARAPAAAASASPAAASTDDDPAGDLPAAMTPDVVPVQAATSPATPGSAPDATGTSSPASASAGEPTSLAIENEMLARAGASLRAGQASGTIRITAEHARRFPDSPLVDLRAALRIEALCALDKVPQARGEARLFVREHAGSPLLRRIEKSCAKAP